jgi:hypothetical protein
MVSFISFLKSAVFAPRQTKTGLSKLVGDIIVEKTIPWFRRLPFFWAP